MQVRSGYALPPPTSLRRQHHLRHEQHRPTGEGPFGHAHPRVSRVAVFGLSAAFAGPHGQMPFFIPPLCHWCRRIRQISRAFTEATSKSNLDEAASGLTATCSGTAAIVSAPMSRWSSRCSGTSVDVVADAMDAARTAALSDVYPVCTGGGDRLTIGSQLAVG